MAGRKPEHEKQVLRQFCAEVQDALENLDSGNGEVWPPPADADPNDLDNYNGVRGPSRWWPLWKSLEKVRKYYGL